MFILDISGTPDLFDQNSGKTSWLSFKAQMFMDSSALFAFIVESNDTDCKTCS